MKRLDTNILIELTDVGSKSLPRFIERLAKGDEFACSSIAWSEYCNGPILDSQKRSLLKMIDESILPFDRKQAEIAAELFNETGRKRSSKSDFMIAASAIHYKAQLSTNNLKDFKSFIPFGLIIKKL